MHTNPISPARKILLGLAASVALAFLAGCETVTLSNLTPGSMPENPSQIYTFTLRVTPHTNTVIKGSVTPHIVIDGQNQLMKPSSLGEGLYEYEHRVAAGRDEMAYYYLVNYTVEGNSVVTPGEAYTEISRAKIMRRYVLKLEDNRGPVGARISVVGRGFTEQDKIFFNGTEARTKIDSQNSLSFFVPALEGNKNYQVVLNSGSGSSPVGTFRIDASSLAVSPTALTLRTGERQSLTFTLSNAAPPGGTLLDVATDVPESVIMPEIIVPAGQMSATVTVEGGKPGTGSLFLKGFGAGEVTVPVSVTGK